MAYDDADDDDSGEGHGSGGSSVLGDERTVGGSSGEVGTREGVNDRSGDREKDELGGHGQVESLGEAAKHRERAGGGGRGVEKSTSCFRLKNAFVSHQMMGKRGKGTYSSG
jgi:hypothetical protein